MDFYLLDYIFAETQFTSGLSANLRETFSFAQLSDRYDSPTVTLTHVCQIDVPSGTPEHLAAQTVIDEGISFFTTLLSKNPIDDIKFRRIDVLKAVEPSADGYFRTFALVVDYAVPPSKAIKSL